MKRLIITLALLVTPAHADAFSIFACEPEWAALASTLGGPDVEVYAATSARQDPHQVQARPALVAKMRTADLVVCTGAGLEAGWLPILLRQGANPKVQPGAPGFFEAAAEVDLKEIPVRLDRADGDVHGAGNPHIQTDPRNILAIADVLGRRIAALDPLNAERHAVRTAAFIAAMKQSIVEWERRAAPLRGTSVGVQHRSWIYLLDWLGMKEAAVIEPKPGVPPGGGHMVRLARDLPREGVTMILFAAYQDGRVSQALAEMVAARAVMLPFTVGGTDQAQDLFSLYDDTITRLLAANARN